MRKIGKRFGILTGVALWITPLIAQPPLERGSTFVVHSAPEGRQYHPVVVASADSEFLVVWNNFSSVQARRFGPDGSPLGDDFQINSHPSFIEGAAAAYGPAGEFVVTRAGGAWPDAPLAYRVVIGRRFGADGVPLGEDFKLSSTPNEFERYSRVAIGPDGRILAAWESTIAHYGCCIMARFFAADGTPLGPDFQLVNWMSGQSQGHPNVAFGPSGESLAVWATTIPVGPDIYGFSVQAQLFDANGDRRGTPFQVNKYVRRHQNQPQPVVAPNGDILVVWTSDGSGETDQSKTSIHGRRFTGSGTPLGQQFQINTHTLGRQFDPIIGGFDASGETLVVWTSDGSENDFYPTSVRGRRYRADGTAAGDEFVIDTAPPNEPYFQLPSVAVSRSSEVFVVWRHRLDSDILAQRYALELFADSFESGDASSWSELSPP